MRGPVETSYFIILSDDNPEDADLAQCIFLDYHVSDGWTFLDMNLMRIPRTIDKCGESDRDRQIFRGTLVRAPPGTCTFDTQVEYDGQVISAAVHDTMAWHDVKRICRDAGIHRSSCS